MSAFLTPDNIRIDYGLEIKEKLIPDGSKFKPNHALTSGTPKYVTIHNTADINEAPGTNDAEQYTRATYNGNMGGVSVHYYIDETDCWQLLREDEMGFHAADGYGPGNGTSIAIEIIMDGSGRDYDVKAEERGALLAATILHRHGLSIDRLTTHKHWYPQKDCPVYILPHWDAFVAKVKNNLAKIEAADKAQNEAGNDDKSDILYRVQCGAFTYKDNAESYAQTIREKGFEAVTIKTDVLWKVQCGAFKVRANAETYMAQLKKAGFPAFITETTVSEPAVIKGDVDGDGNITAADARLAMRAAVGLEELTAAQKEAADMDGDGCVTAADGREILRKATGVNN